MFEDFALQIKKFYDRIDDMDQCILRFDKTMSVKANKSQLMLLDDKIKQLFDVKANNETLSMRVNAMTAKVDDTYRRIYEYIEEC